MESSSRLQAARQLFSLREFKKSDIPFIVDAWVEGFARSKYSGTLSPDIFHKAYREQVSNIISRNTFRATVVSSRDHSNVMAGFIAWEESVKSTAVHWVYVKSMYRRIGIADWLKSSLPLRDSKHITHMVSDRGFKKCVNKLFPNYKFSPNFARFDKSNEENRIYSNE